MIREWVNDDLVLVEKIGTGGMAEIFRALQFGVGGSVRQVAVKRVLPHLVGDEHFIKSFLDEVRIATRLMHPNIVQLYCSLQYGELPLVVMEFVEGRHLARIIEQCRAVHRFLTPAQVAYIGAEIATGLEFAHTVRDEEGNDISVIHRDISPQNLMVSSRGEVKILDFGVARASDNLSLTRTGFLKGKLGYMAPEYACQGELDRRADIFSLGVVLFELATSTVMFPGPSAEACFRQLSEFRGATGKRHERQSAHAASNSAKSHF